ncbi:metallophosphoesterase [Candidatus Bipolaricaulota bacterium]|nr:metallophosphoesterase [Candidatus Bipolaricaulota bacterium]
MQGAEVQVVGIMADSHDNMDFLARAVDFFNEGGVDLVLHAGDFISPLTVGPLSDLECELIGVFGNNDGDRLFLREKFGQEGVGRIERNPYQFEVGGKNVVLMHQPRLLEILENSPTPDLIVYGHTHEVDVRRGNPLIVNPGEVGGWMTGKASVGLVDLRKLEVEIKEL